MLNQGNQPMSFPIHPRTLQGADVQRTEISPVVGGSRTNVALRCDTPYQAGGSPCQAVGSSLPISTAVPLPSPAYQPVSAHEALAHSPDYQLHRSTGQPPVIPAPYFDMAQPYFQTSTRGPAPRLDSWPVTATPHSGFATQPHPQSMQQQQQPPSAFDHPRANGMGHAAPSCGHIKFSWKDPSCCFYQRLPPGYAIRVSAPNNRQPVELIPSERLLVTRGSIGAWNDLSLSPAHAVLTGGLSTAQHRSLSHCAHYYFNNECVRGEECGFVHVMIVDPSLQVPCMRFTERIVIAAPRPNRNVACGSNPGASLGSAPSQQQHQMHRTRSFSNQAASPLMNFAGEHDSIPRPFQSTPREFEPLVFGLSTNNTDLASTSTLLGEGRQPRETSATELPGPQEDCGGNIPPESVEPRDAAAVAPSHPIAGKKFHFNPYSGSSRPTITFLRS